MLSSRFGGHYPIASICWVPLKGIYMKSQMACEELKEYRIFEHTTVGTPQIFWRTCGVMPAMARKSALSSLASCKWRGVDLLSSAFREDVYKGFAPT